jgi:RHS repeat-associated protein
MYETAADGTFGIAYDSFGRITALPSQYAGGSALTTSYYGNEMVAGQSQGAVTNTLQLDSELRQRQRVQMGGSLEGAEVFHYAGPSDSPAWTERGSSWTRYIGGMGGIGAIQENGKEAVLQLADLHGDIVATASLSKSATEPTATFQFDEFGNPTKGSAGRFGWLGGKQRRTELPSGVIQMGVRSYVPTIGRFISIDSVAGGSANTYDYANADPVNGLDLTGTAACQVHRGKAKIGAVTRFPGNKRRVEFTVTGSASCSKSTRDRHLSVQITGGVIRQPPPLVVKHLSPQISSSTTCPKYTCSHGANGHFSATVPCNTEVSGSINVTVRISWLPAGSNTLKHEEETYRYPIGYGRECNIS